MPGQQLVYVISVTNAGPSNAAGVTIADAFPAGIANDTYTTNGTSGASGFTASGNGSINDTSVNLAAGSSVTYLVMANVSAAATGTLSNTATAKAGTGETNTFPSQVSGTTTSTSTDTLSPQVDLVVTTTDDGGGSSAGAATPGNVVPGGTVTYTITVENTGPSNAVGVAVADALPAGITSDTYTATGTAGASGFTASGSGSIDDASVSLAAGSSIIYTIIGNVSAAATGTLSNTATAKIGTGETNTNPGQSGGTTSATDVDTLTPQVDLVVTKTDDAGGSSDGSAGNVTPGGTVTYTITVQNTGPSAAVGVAIADVLPAGVTSDTYTAVGTTGASGFTASGSGNISDTSVNLASGASLVYTVTANIDPAATGTLSNTATATAGSGESNTNSSQIGGITSATDIDEFPI